MATALREREAQRDVDERQTETVRERMAREDREYLAASRVGRAEERRERGQARWDVVIKEHLDWLEHLDSIHAVVSAELAKINAAIDAWKTNEKRDEAFDKAEIDGKTLTIFRWRVRRQELFDTIRDIDEGPSGLPSGLLIEHLAARGVRPRYGCTVLFENRTGRVKTRTLLREAREERKTFE